MNSKVLLNISRFVILLLLQVLVFRGISMYWGGFTYVHFMVYPLFILLLPIRMPPVAVIGLAFLIGISVDVFYDSPGVHAAASVFLGYIRGLIIKILEPYEGYNMEDSPTLKTMGLSWFVTYLAITLSIFLFVYFSIEAFSFVYIFDIVLDTIFTFIASFIVLVLIQFVFRTKY